MGGREDEDDNDDNLANELQHLNDLEESLARELQDLENFLESSRSPQAKSTEDDDGDAGIERGAAGNVIVIVRGDNDGNIDVRSRDNDEHGSITHQTPSNRNRVANDELGDSSLDDLSIYKNRTPFNNHRRSEGNWAKGGSSSLNSSHKNSRNNLRNNSRSRGGGFGRKTPTFDRKHECNANPKNMSSSLQKALTRQSTDFEFDNESSSNLTREVRRESNKFAENGNSNNQVHRDGKNGKKGNNTPRPQYHSRPNSNQKSSYLERSHRRSLYSERNQKKSPNAGKNQQRLPYPERNQNRSPYAEKYYERNHSNRSSNNFRSRTPQSNNSQATQSTESSQPNPSTPNNSVNSNNPNKVFMSPVTPCAPITPQTPHSPNQGQYTPSQHTPNQNQAVRPPFTGRGRRARARWAREKREKMMRQDFKDRENGEGRENGQESSALLLTPQDLSYGEAEI